MTEAQISDGNSCEEKQTYDELVKSLLDSENEFFTNIFNECDEDTKVDASEEEEEEEEEDKER